MKLTKKYNLISYFDIYQNLFTKKQSMYFQEYYFFDKTLQEIAEEHNISKNAVFDAINKTEKQLENYEKKLQFVKTNKEIQNIIESYLNKKISFKEFRKKMEEYYV